MRTALKMAAMGGGATPWNKCYYVDATLGLDTNDGKSIGAPLKTIAAVEALTLNPGESVLFKGGEVWREQCEPPVSGLTFGSYGTGKAKIYGSIVPSSWTEEDKAFTATLAKVQGPYVGIGTAPIVSTFAAGPTQGNLLIACLSCTGSTAGISSAALTGWTNATSATEGSGNGFASIWYKVAGVGESTTVSATVAGQTGLNLIVEEWSGLTSPVLDRVALTNDGGSAVSSRSSGTTATTTAAYEVCIACFAAGSTVTSRTYTNSWAAEYGTDAVTLFVASKAVSAKAAQETTFAWTTARRVGGCIATFGGTETVAPLYYATQATLPASVWCVNTNTTISWGNYKASKATLVAEYDWWWDDPNDRLYMFAATDPATRYTAVEVAARDYCFFAAIGVDSLTFDGLDIAYCRKAGITVRNTSLVENCEAHHVGDRVSGNTYNALAAAISLMNSVGSTVKNNVVHDAGRRGISLSNLVAAGTTSNNIIQNNEVYDCFHTCIDINGQGTGTYSANIVRYNYVHYTAGMAMEPGASSYDGISWGGDDAGNIIDGTQIYYNIVLNCPQKGIESHDYTSNSVIYNNAVYGTHSSSASLAISGIKAGGAHASGTNNIRNNIVVCTKAGGAAGYIVTNANVAVCDYNLWYHSLGGAGIYMAAGGTDYHYNDLAALQGVGFEAHGLWADPSVTSATDMHPQGGSQVINAGVNVGLTLDYAAAAVSNPPSIGVYE